MTDTFRDEVGAYLLGSLPEIERAEFEVHLRDCATCRAEVRELGHLPGLLALVPSEGASDPPPSVLESLLEAVHLERARRRLWLAGAGIAAAALVGVTLSGELIPMPWSEQEVGVGTRVELRALTGASVSAEVELVSVPWGTQVNLRCSYSGDRYAQPVEYALVVYDGDGRSEQVASWTALSGAEASVPAATSMRLDQISRLEMTADGSVVLVGET